MNASGVWKGSFNGKIGHFKFINVEVMPDQKGKVIKKLDRSSRKVRPATVDELLTRIRLKEYTSVFVLNGWVAKRVDSLGFRSMFLSLQIATRIWSCSRSLNPPTSTISASEMRNIERSFWRPCNYCTQSTLPGLTTSRSRARKTKKFAWITFKSFRRLAGGIFLATLAATKDL